MWAWWRWAIQTGKNYYYHPWDLFSLIGMDELLNTISIRSCIVCLWSNSCGNFPSTKFNIEILFHFVLHLVFYVILPMWPSPLNNNKLNDYVLKFYFVHFSVSELQGFMSIFSMLCSTMNLNGIDNKFSDFKSKQQQQLQKSIQFSFRLVWFLFIWN